MPMEILFSFQADFFPFAIERGLVNAKNFRRFGQAGGSFQDFAQMRFLQFFQRNQRADLRHIFTVGGCHRVLTAQFGGKILREKFVALWPG